MLGGVLAWQQNLVSWPAMKISGSLRSQSTDTGRQEERSLSGLSWVGTYA